jgi:3-dehydroquinate synthase
VVTAALTVRHAAGEYPVYVGAGILEGLHVLVQAHAPGRRTAMIADDTVAALFRDFVRGTESPWRAVAATCEGVEGAGWMPFTFPAGEASKTRATWEQLTDALLAAGYGRDAAIVALGGGVTGDLAGFVAATYMRGIPVVQVPTTLLAMVDSSVGGKVGVDTPAGKNLVGAFHAPAAVVADPLTLGTLTDRDYRAGLAEVVKHALVGDEGHFAWLEKNAVAVLRRDPDALTEVICRSVELKSAVVAEDERESGRRAILNAGHTVAHAIEQATGYGIRHGEAVALGLVAECRLGEAIGVTAAGTADRVAALLAGLGLPVELAGCPPVGTLTAAMQVDKKTRSGFPGFAFAAGPGRMHRQNGDWVSPAPTEAVEEALATIRG